MSEDEIRERAEAVERAVLDARTRDVIGERQWWFYVRVILSVLGGLFIIVSFLWGITTMIGLQEAQAEQTADIKALVEFVAGVDSPEAQEATARMLERVLANADCDNRDALHELVVGLEREGMIERGAIHLPCDSPPEPIGPGAALVPQGGGDGG